MSRYLEAQRAIHGSKFILMQSQLGAEKVEMESLEINLRPERDVTLYVEIFNPLAQIPLIITPEVMAIPTDLEVLPEMSPLRHLI